MPIRTPPIEGLHAIRDALGGAGIPFALGGSGLLAALGLVDTVADWDLVTDDPIDRVALVARDFKGDIVGPTGIYKTEGMARLQVRGAPIDLMSRFAIRHDAGVFRVHATARGAWNGVPLGAPEIWAAAYALIRRDEKADALFTHLRSVGVHEPTRKGVLKQPLPGDLKRRLLALPRRETLTSTANP